MGVVAGGCAAEGVVDATVAAGSGANTMVRVENGRLSCMPPAVSGDTRGAPCSSAPWTMTTASVSSTKGLRACSLEVEGEGERMGMGEAQFNSERQFPHETRNLPRRLT